MGNLGEELNMYELPEGFALTNADPDIFHPARQDSAWYKNGDGDLVVTVSFGERHLDILCVGDMKIAYKDTYLRYLQDLLEYGITDDNDLYNLGDDCWVNNSWFEIYDNGTEEYYEEPIHTVREAISYAITCIQEEKLNG